MTTRPFQFAGIEDSDRPKCELLERCQHSEAQPSPKSRPPNSEQLRRRFARALSFLLWYTFGQMFAASCARPSLDADSSRTGPPSKKGKIAKQTLQANALVC